MTPTKNVYDVKRKATEFELRDNVLERLGGKGTVAHTGINFRQYQDGYWPEVHDYEIAQEVGKELDCAYAMGAVTPSYNKQMSVTNAMKVETFVPADKWDKHPEIIVFKNYALDTSSMQTVGHDPQHYATTALPYNYDPTATAPIWNKVLKDLLGDKERGFLQEFAGYCLTSSVEHQMSLWLVGPPGGGKSTLIEGLEAMLGSLVGTLGLATLQGNGSRFALANIPGKTLLACTETPGGSTHIKASDILNALITGDTIPLERKNKDIIPHKNTAKLLWAMNNLPSLYDPNNGLFRRVKLLEVPVIPHNKQDSKIIEQVKMEGAGIINWALEGLQRLNQRSHFDYPNSVQNATKAFKESNDLPGLFIEERCDLTLDTNKEKAGDLVEAFNRWAIENGHTKWSAKSLAPNWKRHFGEPTRDKHGLRYSGVKLRK